MRNGSNEIKGKLYGVGIGPGDPKLLTLRAKEILNEVKTIFVPKASEGGKSCARSIVEALALGDKNFIELTFPMTKDKNKLQSYWLNAAKIIVEELKKNKAAAFVTIGDPFIYSTYIYLLETLRSNFPYLETETIPGISAFGAAAASIGLPLLKGDEKMAILPVVKNLKGLKEALKEFDTVVLMKIGSKLESIIRLLKKMKLLASSVLISHAGQANERIVRDLASLEDKNLGYLSVIIVRNISRRGHFPNPNRRGHFPSALSRSPLKESVPYPKVGAE
ncbi:MAG: precorrin-2 C(20)-methyltransferase [Candidatus Omnitrophota bacterium]|nr:precorrin-2 C(20)-methyltransferase [Candidatus Omnitrophota bacterium]